MVHVLQGNGDLIVILKSDCKWIKVFTRIVILFRNVKLLGRGKVGISRKREDREIMFY